MNTNADTDHSSAEESNEQSDDWRRSANLDVSGDDPTINLGVYNEDYVKRPFRIFLLTDLPDSLNESKPEWIDDLIDEYENMPDIKFVTPNESLYGRDEFDFHTRRLKLSKCGKLIKRCDAILYRFTGEPTVSELLQLGMVMSTDRKVTDGNITIWNTNEKDTSELEQWLPSHHKAKEAVENDYDDTLITYENRHEAIGNMAWLYGGYQRSFLCRSRSPETEIQNWLSELMEV